MIFIALVAPFIPYHFDLIILLRPLETQQFIVFGLFSSEEGFSVAEVLWM
jgi:hypothetical protein